MSRPVRVGAITICLAAAMFAAQQQTRTAAPPAPPAPGSPEAIRQQEQQQQQTARPQAGGGSAPTVVVPQSMQPAPPASNAAKPAQESTSSSSSTSAASSGVTTQAVQPVVGGLNLHNASLTEVINQLARMLKINYLLDPRVKGGVYLNTFGEVKDLDTRSLLDIILRINGAGMVKVGDLYRIVPLAEIGRLPMAPESKTSSKDIVSDDQPMLNLVFLKYVTVEELSKVIDQFIGEGARTISYPPANLLFILDSHRNMRRTMDLIAMFDSDTLANQRVRLFEVKNGRPSDIAQELTTILKSMSLNEKSSTIKFLPVDRINTIIAVAPNPGAFDTVETWVRKLDVPIKSSGGAMDTYVYRVKYGRAECLGMSLMQLYGAFYGGPQFMNMMGMMGMMGGYGMGGYGGSGGGGGGGTIGGSNSGLGVGGGCGGLGGGMGMGMGYGMGGYGMGGYGMGGYGMGGYGMGGYGMNPYGGGYGMGGYGGYAPQYPQSGAPTGQAGAQGGQGDLTGSYLGNAQRGGAQSMEQMPRIVPNPTDNSLLIQATPAQYQSIVRLMDQIDIPPRQILLEAKIYEVSLTGAFASGVSAFLQKLTAANTASSPHDVIGSFAGSGVNLSAGAFVGASRELLAFLNLQENATRAKVVSAPSLIATDSINASITVGNEVPTLTAQAAGNVTVSGNSTFTQQIQSRQTGVTLNVNAHVNPSGIVTLIINQEVSAPEPPTAASAIQSPSFSKRSVQTQITMQDGDTIAIGGIINESNSMSSTGIPVLHKIPILGSAFGNRSYSKDRTELIVFMTPHVIYDNNDLQEASDELKGRLKKLRKVVRE